MVIKENIILERLKELDTILEELSKYKQKEIEDGEERFRMECRKQLIKDIEMAKADLQAKHDGEIRKAVQAEEEESEKKIKRRLQEEEKKLEQEYKNKLEKELEKAEVQLQSKKEKELKQISELKEKEKEKEYVRNLIIQREK